MESKADIRKRVLGLRNSLSAGEIAVKSGEIVARLIRVEAIRKSSTLMVYLNFGSEVVTDELIRWGWEEGKGIVVPFCRPAGRVLTPCLIESFDELERGSYGIREPRVDRLRVVPHEEIDAVLVPAVAFDRKGYRVGYGGGYYDRFLPQVPRAAKIGAAFVCQVVEAVPVDRYDARVERIMTEEGIVFAAEGRLPA